MLGNRHGRLLNPDYYLLLDAKGIIVIVGTRSSQKSLFDEYILGTRN